MCEMDRKFIYLYIFVQVEPIPQVCFSGYHDITGDGSV